MTPPAKANLGNKTLLGDLRRMAPVWAIVAGAAILALVAIRQSGAAYLRSGVVELADKCRVAEIHFEKGRRQWRALLERVGEDPRRVRTESSMGELKGDATVAEVRRAMHEALDLCPRLRGPHRLLADLAWWEGDTAATHYHLGAEHRLAGEWSMALAEFQTSLDMDAKNADAALAAAEMGARLEQWDAVERTLAALPAAAQNKPAALRARAALAERRGAFDEAIADLFAAAELEPGNIETVRALFRLHYDRVDRVAAADRLYKSLQAARSPEAESYHQVALLYMRAQRWDSALAPIDMSIALAANNVDLQFDKAIILTNLGRIGEAQRVGETALSINPELFWKRVEDARFNPLAGDSGS